MSETFTQPLADEQIFAHLVAELEEAVDAQAVVADYCRRYPHVSTELHAKAALMNVLETLRPIETDVLPAQLGEFRVIRRVTRGGMGEVFEAEQTSLGRRVAVKTIRRDRISPLAQARFMREQTVLASLHQTHIVSIHTAGTEGPLVYFAMPFIEGATLRQLIDLLRERRTATPGARTPALAELAGQTTAVRREADAKTAPPEKPVPAMGTWPRRSETDSQAGAPSLGESRPRAPFRLSHDYFRSAAQVMIDAADALQHAHDLHVLHRDMKPSNLMVDTSGQCWIIDFGLAAHIGVGDPASPLETPLASFETVTGHDVLGTPAYMAPEQWDGGKVDARTDVWGLGATLYELLTLQRPFREMERSHLQPAIRRKPPTPPRRIVANVPKDLDAICLHALQKEPEHRYPTAQAFADDLRRWLNREPPSVRRGVPRRIHLWSARNKGWAAAILLALVAVGGLVAAAVIREEAAAARQLAAEQQVSSVAYKLLKKLQSDHSSSKELSWRNDILREAGEAAKIRPDVKLRDDAASALVGIDGRMTYDFNAAQCTSVAIDAAGKRILGGGTRSRRSGTGARLSDFATDQGHVLSEMAAGPVAFRLDDGVPLQLTAAPDKPLGVSLWNVATDSRLWGFELPLESGAAFATTWNGDPLLALTSDGRMAGAAVRLGENKNAIFVWDAKTGSLLRQLKRDGSPLMTLTFDPAGSQLASGQSDGQIVIWPLPTGEPEMLPRSDHAEVYALGFGRAPWLSDGQPTRYRLLAAGSQGGHLTIWNLDRSVPQAYCHGSWYGVYSVAFSPDGTTLASGGRGPISLWDTATGRRLIAFDGADMVSGLAFTRDGKRLAASSMGGSKAEQGIRIWDLEMGRGIFELRGLTSPIANVCTSPNRNRVAALGHNWQIAVWDLTTGFLERVVSGPEGVTADHAALEFSPDGKRLFSSAGSDARLWDLTSGAVQEWSLPGGARDSAAFDAGGTNLLLYRTESDGREQVGRMRNLLGREPEKPLWENRFFSTGVSGAVMSRDATLVAVHGPRGAADREDACKLFRSTTGEEIWSLSGRNPNEGVNVRLDTLGKFMAVDTGRGSPCDLLDLPNCRIIDRMGQFPECLSPGATFGGHGDPGGFALFRRADEIPVVTMGINVRATSMHMQFSADGKLAAWGNIDGSVYVANIEEVRRQLANYGLNW